MRVYIITCVYPPEPVISARTSADIAEKLTKKGHTVKIITAFPNRPAGKIFPGFSRKLFLKEKIGPTLEIRRCFSTLSRQSGLLSRFLENISFGLFSGLQLLILKRPDIIYLNTWPVFASGIISIIAKLKKIPIVVAVQDIYPESLIIQKRIKADSFIARCILAIDTWIAQSAQAVVVISPTFRNIYRNVRKIKKDKIHLIPNWVSENTIDITTSKTAFRSKMGLPDDAFIFVYGGNIGAAADVQQVILAFSRLSQHSTLFLLIAGEGACLEHCKKMVEQLNEKRIIFYSPWPVEETSTVLRTADMLLLPTRGGQTMASVPSKLITYMLAARPVLAIALCNSDTAKIINKAKCGWTINPDSTDLLTTTMASVSKLPEKHLHAKGIAGRTYALGHFSKSKCLPRLLHLLSIRRGTVH